MKLTVRELKPALTNIIGLTGDDTLPMINGVYVVNDQAGLKLYATDRVTAIENKFHPTEDPAEEFEYFLDREAVQLLSKLPLNRTVTFTPDGVSSQNIEFKPADQEFPKTVIELIDNAWKDAWLELPKVEGWDVGYNPALLKHIKDVVIIPHPNGFNQARLIAPGMRGLTMAKKVKHGS